MKLQIAELLFVFHESLQLDHAAAERWVVLIERFGEFEVALGEDGGFEGRDAFEAPGGVGDRLDEIAFADADGAEVGLIGA